MKRFCTPIVKKLTLMFLLKMLAVLQCASAPQCSTGSAVCLYSLCVEHTGAQRDSVSSPCVKTLGGK